MSWKIAHMSYLRSHITYNNPVSHEMSLYPRKLSHVPSQAKYPHPYVLPNSLCPVKRSVLPSCISLCPSSISYPHVPPSIYFLCPVAPCPTSVFYLHLPLSNSIPPCPTSVLYLHLVRTISHPNVPPPSATLPCPTWWRRPTWGLRLTLASVKANFPHVKKVTLYFFHFVSMKCIQEEKTLGRRRGMDGGREGRNERWEWRR